MFILVLCIGLILGANISLIFYAVFLIGKKTENKIKDVKWRN